MTEALLLDTNTILFFGSGQKMKPAALEKIEEMRNSGEVWISPMSYWEIAQLTAKGRIQIDATPKAWLDRFIALEGFSLLGCTPDVLVAAVDLPSTVHRDPVDRILIVTAQTNDLTLVTRDQEILSYGRKGMLKVLPC